MDGYLKQKTLQNICFVKYIILCIRFLVNSFSVIYKIQILATNTFCTKKNKNARICAVLAANTGK